MPTDATIETNVLDQLQQESIQARARPSPWDSSSAPGIGPGFGGDWIGAGGGSLFLGLQQAADEIRQWSYYPMLRDRQLRAFWKTEAILAGGIYSFSARISALPAKIKGPPRAKGKASDMIHALDLQKLVIDMLTTDNGFFIERVGPGRADKPLNPKLVTYLSTMDSAQVWRTFDPEFPAIYINPYTGAYHKLHYSRIISGSSCPQPDELARGIGFCAVSRALRFVQIERDIEIFKHEKVGGRFTRALGIVSGMTQKQFNDNIAAAGELNDSKGFTRYSGIPWLVNVNQEIKASILDLAHLPDGFDAEKDTETYVKVLALAFGTDAREFWPGQGSGAGKADATVQHEKARGKGIADVTSTIERTLNWGVLDALNCNVEFDYTDDAEQMATAQYHFQVITNVATMQQSGNISSAQGTAILVAEGVIDPDVIENVLEAEDSEPADTEAPYTETQTPVQQAPPVAQPPPTLAKPPAAAPQGISTPPGGIKPPPPKPATPGAPPTNAARAMPTPSIKKPKPKPLTPRMNTDDMQPAKKAKASAAPPQFHAATNAYQSKLKALMTAFFADGQPATEADLDARLVKLIHDYLSTANAGLAQAYNTGRQHADPTGKTSQSAKGQTALNAIKKKSHSYFDGLIGDLKTAVLKTMKTSSSKAAFVSDAERRAAFAHMIDDPGTKRLDHVAQLSKMKPSEFSNAAESGKSKVLNAAMSQGLLGYNNQGEIAAKPAAIKENARAILESQDTTYPRAERVAMEAGTDKNGNPLSQDKGERLINEKYANHAAAVIAVAKREKVWASLTHHERDTLTEIAKGNYLDRTYGRYASGDSGKIQHAANQNRRSGVDTRSMMTRMNDRAEFMHTTGGMSSKEATDEKAIGNPLNWIRNRLKPADENDAPDYEDAPAEDITDYTEPEDAAADGDFAALADGFINRIGQYAGHFWNAIQEGLGSIFNQQDMTVTRNLDEAADHCATCPDKAGDYKSWDAMVNAVGVPGDGSDDCLGNCRCYVSGALSE